jgi:hypothetical protein
MSPFVFIVGCPRSGTTLLQRVVNAHPHVAVINQSQWIPVYWKRRIGLTAEGLVTPKLVRRLLTYRKLFQELGIGREDLERLLGDGGPVPYARYVTGVFDLFGRAQGKALVGDKTPIYVRSIDTLHALWPGAKFVHLIRDGRDVCLSTINWKKQAAKLASKFNTWGEAAVVTAALRWEWNVRMGRQAGRPLGPELYYELRYEALVNRPAEECGKLCAFLGVPYDGAMLRFHEGRTKTEPGLDTKEAWLPITPGLRDWRTQMPPEDRELFEAAAGDLLDELGYPRGGPGPRPEALEHAARVREQFTKNLRARSKALPDLS